jgi:hypothetical protein
MAQPGFVDGEAMDAEDFALQMAYEAEQAASALSKKESKREARERVKKEKLEARKKAHADAHRSTAADNPINQLLVPDNMQKKTRGSIWADSRTVGERLVEYVRTNQLVHYVADLMMRKQGENVYVVMCLCGKNKKDVTLRYVSGTLLKPEVRSNLDAVIAEGTHFPLLAECIPFSVGECAKVLQIARNDKNEVLLNDPTAVAAMRKMDQDLGPTVVRLIGNPINRGIAMLYDEQDKAMGIPFVVTREQMMNIYSPVLKKKEQEFALHGIIHQMNDMYLKKADAPTAAAAPTQ